jgi:hypothetical protein
MYGDERDSRPKGPWILVAVLFLGVAACHFYARTYFNPSSTQSRGHTTSVLLAFERGQTSNAFFDCTCGNTSSCAPPYTKERVNGIQLTPRPLLHGGPSCIASKEQLDAGVCLKLAPEHMTCLPSFIIIGAMKAGTAELQVGSVCSSH